MNKKIFLPFVLAITYINSALSTFALMNVGGKPINANLQGTTDSADVAIQRMIGVIISFLYILAVIFGLYGGFMILTAGGADDKVKKGKTVLIQALLGLVVIWLASSIITWLVTIVLK